MFLTQESKTIIIDTLNQEVEPEFIYLFGSYATGEAKSESDIDIAIYLNKQITPYELFLISNKLSLRLKKDIDLINLNETSTVFAAQIVSKGHILYTKDDILRQTYSMKIFKEYAKLNEERKVVLDSIREDGSIYEK